VHFGAGQFSNLLVLLKRHSAVHQQFSISQVFRI